VTTLVAALLVLAAFIVIGIMGSLITVAAGPWVGGAVAGFVFPVIVWGLIYPRWRKHRHQ
jgi:hypothetical protein